MAIIRDRAGRSDGRRRRLVHTRQDDQRIRADVVAAVRDALDTLSRMRPSEAPRFRRLVEDVASYIAAAPARGGAFQ
jgi:hypothetical protein